MNCVTCENRGKTSKAERVVGGTPMCLPCFTGKPVHPEEMLGEPTNHAEQLASRKSLQHPATLRQGIAIRRRLESRQ